MPGNRSVFRIIGGKWRGRKVQFSTSPGLRISGDRLRETLFNCLGQQLSGHLCLDLFAGAGALGLEAASRGAEVICVERRRETADELRRAAATLAAVNVKVHTAAAAAFLSACRTPFDLIFLDPPFAEYATDSAWYQLLLKLPLSDGGLAYCESDRHWPPPPGWAVSQRKKTGAVCWQLLGRA